MKASLFLLALALPVHAADLAPSALMHDIEGVYKHRFMNGIIAPGKAPREADEPYESEDVVEIVPYDGAHIYVRADLQFYNGHVCSIAGMARYEHGAFVYREPTALAGSDLPCVLSVTLTSDKLILTDRDTPAGSSTCRMHCGARGSLTDYAIARSSRRKIRYLDRLKASQEFKQAVDELRQVESSAATSAKRQAPRTARRRAHRRSAPHRPRQ